MLEATEQLLAERHFGNLSVQDIVARAKSSVGAFYRQFGDKQGLMDALEERYREERASTLETFGEQRWASVALEGRIRAFVEFAIRANRERIGLFRAMWLRAWGAAPARPEGSTAFTPADTYTTFLLARRDEIRHPRPERAVRVGVMAVILLANQLTLFDYTRSAISVVPGSDEELVEELTHLLYGYLVRPSATPDGS